jgi:S-formylglutathione hydrolase FrmB
MRRTKTGLHARALAALTAIAALTIAATTLAVAPAAPAGATPPTLPAPNSHGITLQSWAQVTPSEPATVPRLLDATVTTAAIFQPRGTPSIDPVTIPIKVRIYLPANYRTDPSRPYPVLYLLHGGAGTYSDWSDASGGDLKNTLNDVLSGSDFDGIVVMPEGGRSGWYSDWYGATDGHFAPQWETFHIGQLVGWIDDNFNTVDNRSGRTIAGLSMGGLGALGYAGRHTDLFSAVGSFSGGTDLTEPGAQSIVNDSMWFYGATVADTGFLDGTFRVTGSTAYRMQTVFGPPVAGDWPTKNPLRLADVYNAYDTRFGLYAGQNTSSLEGERQIGIWNDEFHAALDARGVDHRYCTGTGTHSWSFWKNDLKDFLNYVYGTTPSQCTANPGWTRVS